MCWYPCSGWGPGSGCTDFDLFFFLSEGFLFQLALRVLEVPYNCVVSVELPGRYPLAVYSFFGFSVDGWSSLSLAMLFVVVVGIIVIHPICLLQLQIVVCVSFARMWLGRKYRFLTGGFIFLHVEECVYF